MSFLMPTQAGRGLRQGGMGGTSTITCGAHATGSPCSTRTCERTRTCDSASCWTSTRRPRRGRSPGSFLSSLSRVLSLIIKTSSCPHHAPSLRSASLLPARQYFVPLPPHPPLPRSRRWGWRQQPRRKEGQCTRPSCSVVAARVVRNDRVLNGTFIHLCATQPQGASPIGYNIIDTINTMCHAVSRSSI